MRIVAVHEGKIEIFKNVEKVEQEGPYRFAIGIDSGVRAEEILILPD